MGCRNKALKEQNKVLVEVDTAEEAAMAYDTAADKHQGTKDSHNHRIHWSTIWNHTNKNNITKRKLSKQNSVNWKWDWRRWSSFPLDDREMESTIWISNTIKLLNFVLGISAFNIQIIMKTNVNANELYLIPSTTCSNLFNEK